MSRINQTLAGTPPVRARLATAGFTLIDLLISMTVFAVMITFLVATCASAQRAWRAALHRTEMFENARLALDIIARDLQSIHYSNGKVPFWHKPITKPADTWDDPAHRNEMLAFIASTAVPQSANNSSYNYEIKYQVHCTNSMDVAHAGWLRRSVTGDSSNSPLNPTDPDKNKWHYSRPWGWNDANDATTWSVGGGPGDWPNNSQNYSVVGQNDSRYVFTQGSASSDAFQKLIPYVTELEFTCFDVSGDIVSDKWKIGDAGAPPYVNYDYSNQASPFPFMVMVRLSVLDRIAWERWKVLGGLPHHPMHPQLAPDEPLDVNDPGVKFRKANQRTFTKMVLIGDRGQYQ